MSSDPADYGPVRGDDGPDPEDAVCRVCGRGAFDHTRGRYSVYGVCPVPVDSKAKETPK